MKRRQIFPRVVVWTLLDHRRVTPVPPGHWLLIEDTAPFRATLEMQKREWAGTNTRNMFNPSPLRNGHVACFPPRADAAEAELVLERYAATSQKFPPPSVFFRPNRNPKSELRNREDLVLLTNGIGGMARICVDLGRVNSKYDCVLGANLHPNVPVDRHVFVKRIRVWVNADGFLSPLDFKNLSSFAGRPAGGLAFVANAGDGRTVEIELRAEMLEGKNTTVFQFSRPTAERAIGKQLPADADVRLTVRFDIEDRNFHWETKRNGGADYHFSTNTHELQTQDPKSRTPIGFAFTPAPDRQLRVFADAGEYHPQPEWCENIPHPVEQSRGQTGSGDAYSPGWFELPLPKGASVTLVATAEEATDVHSLRPAMPACWSDELGRAERSEHPFEQQLLRAARQFVVRRDEGKTVIAGYPWFLDWGRDTLICARGLLAAGMAEEVRQILLTFAKFEKDGTLPNAHPRRRRFEPRHLRRAAVVRPGVRRFGTSSSLTIFIQRRLTPAAPSATCWRASRQNYSRRHAQRHPHGRGFGADLEPGPFHLDGHEPSRRHAARRLSGRNPGFVDSPAAPARKNFRAR